MSISRLKRLIIACGKDLSDDSFDTGDLMHEQFVAVVGLKKVDGDEKNDVKDYLPMSMLES